MASDKKKDFRFGIDSSANGLDLNQLLVHHPSSTFFMRLDNDVAELELKARDVLQVDRSLTPKKSDVVVVYQNDEAGMRVIQWQGKQGEIQVWGVVTNLIRHIRV